ncbi:uncharacterized protein N7484_008327 [Penicillium longicatenatum]|uniref:uncharacterized protein n=1 Tax=Penicillium longicatenatum TaxID=1561947 RepID=UPI002548F4E1|nr:uncharacterized protein N7484_008327 [Penicillium longicatenatum]KAJ5635014.1 hypothetical protein N7484_008327 [Penicillium longicatenatum]
MQDAGNLFDNRKSENETRENKPNETSDKSDPSICCVQGPGPGPLLLCAPLGPKWIPKWSHRPPYM